VRLITLMLLALLAAACGGDDEPAADSAPLRVVLDFVPNAVHSGLYVAQERGLFEREGLDVELVAPTQTAQPLAQVAAGQADLALADLIDVAIARAEGSPLTVVAAVVQAPLVSVMTRADSPITRPRELAGHKVGLTGVPSDRAVTEGLVRGDGGDPAELRFVTIGFAAVQSVSQRTVDAAIGFWPADGVELERRGGARVFRIERYGAPRFPELVVFGSDKGLLRRADDVRAFLRAAREGYELARADQAAALDDLIAANSGIERESARLSLAAYAPILARDGTWGTLDPTVIAAFVAWGRRTGVLPRDAGVAGLVDASFLQ
jgi:putative hydroxymethylpyrimidine transport system substrate-binding protein